MFSVPQKWLYANVLSTSDMQNWYQHFPSLQVYNTEYNITSQWTWRVQDRPSSCMKSNFKHTGIITLGAIVTVLGKKSKTHGKGNAGSISWRANIWKGRWWVKRAHCKEYYLQKAHSIYPKRSALRELSHSPWSLESPRGSWNQRQIRNTHPLLARKKPGWISAFFFFFYSVLKFRLKLSLSRCFSLKMVLILHEQSFLSVELTFSWSNLLRNPGALPEETGAGQHMVWITSSIPEHFLLRRLLGKCWTQTSLYMRKATPLTERHGGRKSDTTRYRAFVKKMHAWGIYMCGQWATCSAATCWCSCHFLRDFKLITNYLFIYQMTKKLTFVSNSGLRESSAKMWKQSLLLLKRTADFSMIRVSSSRSPHATTARCMHCKDGGSFGCFCSPNFLKIQG